MRPAPQPAQPQGPACCMYCRWWRLARSMRSTRRCSSIQSTKACRGRRVGGCVCAQGRAVVPAAGESNSASALAPLPASGAVKRARGRCRRCAPPRCVPLFPPHVHPLLPLLALRQPRDPVQRNAQLPHAAELLGEDRGLHHARRKRPLDLRDRRVGIERRPARADHGLSPVQEGAQRRVGAVLALV